MNLTTMIMVNPWLSIAITALLFFNIGLLVGAWWQSRPISEGEMRAELNTRQDEHGEGL